MKFENKIYETQITALCLSKITNTIYKINKFLSKKIYILNEYNKSYEKRYKLIKKHKNPLKSFHKIKGLLFEILHIKSYNINAINNNSPYRAISSKTGSNFDILIVNILTGKYSLNIQAKSGDYAVRTLISQKRYKDYYNIDRLIIPKDKIQEFYKKYNKNPNNEKMKHIKNRIGTYINFGGNKSKEICNKELELFTNRVILNNKKPIIISKTINKINIYINKNNNLLIKTFKIISKSLFLLSSGLYIYHNRHLKYAPL